MLKHYTLKRGKPARPSPNDVEGLAAEPTLPKTDSAGIEGFPSPSRTILEEEREEREVEGEKTPSTRKSADENA